MPGTNPRHNHPFRPRSAGLGVLLVLFAILLTACDHTDTSDDVFREDLPVTTAEEFTTHLASLGKPTVVNVWASWCLPCRSEAPLLDAAFTRYGADIDFIGVDVQDNQSDAKVFLAEFGLGFDHFFDRNREVANHYGGLGTPITMFFAPHGELMAIHNGVIDERTLALNIDELLSLG